MAGVASSKAPRKAGPPRTTLPNLVDAVKALAHPGRLRLLAMLRGGDLCVCQMMAVMELPASTVSSHLSDLRRAGLVTERKSGKWVHYHLVTAGPLADLVSEALRLATEDDRLRQDTQAVEDLRRIPLATLCSGGFVRPSTGGRSAPLERRPRRRQTAARRHA